MTYRNNDPYVRIQTVIDTGLAKRDAASNYLRELEQIGVLQAEKRGREVLTSNFQTPPVSGLR